MSDEQLRLLILGAHPDDAEFHAGGLAALYHELGHIVKMVSVTNGGAGHHRLGSEELVQIRRKEAAAAGAVINSVYETWDFPDGSLLPTLEVRQRIIREIRVFRPDLVLTHRTNDYHPDHRAVGQAVQDASYLVTVPLVLPDIPIVDRDPVVAYMFDSFTRPCPFQPDIIIDISSQMDTLVTMLSKHESQVYDFLPFNRHYENEVPKSEEQRLEWLGQWFRARIERRTELLADVIAEQFGEQGKKLKCIEAFEVSEYASEMDEAMRARLFHQETK